MSLLISDNNVLLQFVPNVLKSVQGETLLFDKIALYLEVAEAWLTTTFLSEAVLAELPTRDANNKFVALRAYGCCGRSHASCRATAGFGAYTQWLWCCFKHQYSPCQQGARGTLAPVVGENA